MTFVVFAGATGVTTSDLALYLGLDTIDEARANLILQMAGGVVAAVVGTDTNGDLPTGVGGVVLSAAGRAYTNPTSTTAQMAGPFQQSGGTGGVYLTRAERTTLRGMVGRTGAFSVNLLAGYPDSVFGDNS